ncbi:folylpolyglutamate synthase/dihydrofolate synthase family protein [Parabacteroides sp. PF5-9]|uniref:bifunctional folylpolyglutamate synthase/dihydrofolate synthase n=1 Tax=Parabacteroides sp. PF5-9 TaxID=1742404 RepID=UPI00247702BB|nr:folylpolyglutamate synthase/dihydrofolate synthase family protein [Parabacteroides sp. PF5-9]
MTYEETLHYLYTSTPVFQHSGASAYKPGLGTSLALDELLHNPHKVYKTIHVAGTNGKGSVSHLLAAILQQSGYKVGLYTSPHLVDFRERIRVNGEKISQEYVIDFVERYRSAFEPLQPSFFELTSTMAFIYFRDQKVDFAIIEVGLGGRLDSTNIITPVLSIITNISFDHTQFLGNTLYEIAGEKAGIIKPKVPVVLGDIENNELLQLFTQKAKKENAPIYFSAQEKVLTNAHLTPNGKWIFDSNDFSELTDELGGFVQIRNAKTVLTAIRVLKKGGVNILPEGVREGFEQVTQRTGLMGRWQQLQNKPKVICDTAHNTGGWLYLADQLKYERPLYSTLRMVIGAVNDKDIHGMLALMPVDATYYFTQAAIDRALSVTELALLAESHGLKGDSHKTVEDAVHAALSDANKDDFIFIGGSTFIVAEAIPLFIRDKQ